MEKCYCCKRKKPNCKEKTISGLNFMLCADCYDHYSPSPYELWDYGKTFVENDNSLKNEKINYKEKRYNDKKLELYRRYDIYIDSAEWNDRRLKILKRDKNKCIICEKSADHVHHWVYPKIFGTELSRNMSSLCKKCHDDIHFNFKPLLFNLQKHYEKDPKCCVENSIRCFIEIFKKIK